MATIDKILEERLNTIMENIEYNNLTDEWDAVAYDDLEEADEIDSLDPTEFIEQLNTFLENGEDEIELFYESGDSVVLESSVVEKLLEVYTESELVEGAENIDRLHEMIADVFEEILDIEDEEE